MNATGCHPVPLAAADACEVWCCSDCDSIHINLGAVSLRLKEAHFVGVSTAFQETQYKLEQIKAMPGKATGLPVGRKPN